MAPNKQGEKLKRKYALSRGYALIKQMRLTTSQYGMSSLLHLLTTHIRHQEITFQPAAGESDSFLIIREYKF